MKLEQLQQIIEIEKQQSISKAAEVLFMAQPTLRRSLHNFEDEIGIHLFMRTAKGVVPTAEGEDILALAKQMMDCQNQIKYNSNKRTYYDIRNISDKLCREHGLSVVVRRLIS